MVKDDNSNRICGDFKQTLNPQIHVEQYPMQHIEDMFSTLSGGEKFTKIDLAHAYQQMVVDSDSGEYLTINTRKGLFQYQRLCFWDSLSSRSVPSCDGSDPARFT